MSTNRLGDTLIVLGVIAIIGSAVFGIMGFATPISSGTYEGEKIDYTHQRGLLFQTNDLTTKTNERSSQREDWCVPDDNQQLVTDVRAIKQGDTVQITYTRPLWVWPGTCEGGLKIITDITPVNETTA